MNYLELAQEVRKQCGVAGSGPSAVTGQTGMLALLVGWVNDAYKYIQQESPDWFFMYGEKSFGTIANTDKYTSEMTDVSNIQVISLYNDLSDEAELKPLSYREWRDKYGKGSQTAGRPIHYAIHPDGSLMLGPKPDNVYVVNMDYTKTIASLSANTDEPIIPADYHDAIVYRACMYFSQYEEAQAQFQLFQMYFKDAMSRLTQNQKPNVRYDVQGLA